MGGDVPVLVWSHEGLRRAGAVERLPEQAARELPKLCFGWIDSIKKKRSVDEAVQRYTPRRRKAPYSQPNRERLTWLLERGRVHPSLRADAAAIVRPPFEFPPDILRAIRRRDTAWRWFTQQTGPYRRIRVAYVDGARQRSEEFQKRLDNLVSACAAGKILGFGGIEKYF